MIFIDGDYVYKIDNYTLSLYTTAGSVITEVSYNVLLTAIWGNDSLLFIGTQGSGVFYIDKSILDDSYEFIYENTNIYKEEPDINSNNITHIHGTGDYVAFCTESGVDFFKIEPQGYHSSTTCTGIGTCFVLEERDLFYTVSGSSGFYMCEIDPIINWITPPEPTTNNFLSLVTTVYDFKVTRGEQLIFFVLTDMGVGIYKEVYDKLIFIT